MGETMADRLIRPAIVPGVLAALIFTAGSPAVAPLACGITWTRTGGVWIYQPDCPRQPPPSEQSPDAQPPDPVAPGLAPTP